MKAIRAFLPLWYWCALPLFCVLAQTPEARAAGMIYNPTQADLEAALVGGGTATFACNGTIVLTNTITISTDTILDGNGYTVTISGGNAVRIFQVAPNVNFWIKSLTLSDGRVMGANGADGAPPSPGQDAFAGAILSQRGTLTLTSCVLSNNSAQGGNGGNQLTNALPSPATGGAGFGGAIYVSGGNLNMTNCTVFGNTLTSGKGTPGGTIYQSFEAGDAGDAAGGAIYLLSSTAVLQTVTILGNSVAGGACTIGWYIPGGEASRGGTAAGGAIYATNSNVLIASSALSANSATGGSLLGGNESEGPGSGSGLGASLFISSSSSAAIQGSTLSANVATGGNGFRYIPPGAALGGAVYNLGRLQVSDTRFTTNQCLSGQGSVVPKVGRGGAIYSEGALTINRCTLDNNLAEGGAAAHETPAGQSGAPGEGGAIWTLSSFSATNCTFTTNLALGGQGGGEFGGVGGAGRGGAIMASGGGALVNVTIAGNRADSPSTPGFPAGLAQGGGLAVTNTPPTLRGTVIANSTNGSNVWGVVTDAGYNISSDASASFTGPGSLNNTDPMLDVLADNGGPTPTMALLSGSPAVDRIHSSFPPTDQRGVARPYGWGADAGAFESQTLVGPPPQAPLLSISIVRFGSIYRTTVTFPAQAGFGYRLLFSTDLVAWASIATNSTPTDGQLQFTQSTQPGRPGYFRVVTP